MARIHELAKATMKGGSGGRGVSASLLSGSGGISTGGAKIRAPQISQSAANVRYTPMPVPSIQMDPVANALLQGGQFANTLTNVAFQYQQREDKVVADNAVLQLESELRDMYYGSMDESGTLTGGFANSKELAAAQGYGGFQSQVDAAVTQKFENMTASQKASAVNRFTATRNAYLTKASQHASSELANAEVAATERGFISAMEGMSTSIVTGEQIDIGTIQSALSQFQDPDERKKRDVQMTETLLNGVLQSQGKEAALMMAKTLAATPGIGNPSSIQGFLNGIENRDRSRAGERRAEINFANSQKAQRLSEATAQTTSFLNDNLGTAMTSEGDALGKVMTAVAKRFGDKTSVAKDVIEKATDDAIAEGWNTSKLNGPAGPEDLKAKVMANIDQFPDEVKDNVVLKFEELEAAARTEATAEINFEQKKESAQIALNRSVIDDEIETLHGMDRSDPGFRELAQDVYSRKDATDDQKAQIDHMINNTQNPFAENDLIAIEEDWTDIVANPALLKEYRAISSTEYQKLVKRANIDRAANAGDLRKMGGKELLSYYQLEQSVLSGIKLRGGVDANISEDQAKLNYTRTLEKYNTMMDGFMRLQDGKRAMSAGEAHQKAMSTLLTDDITRAGMTGLPKTTTAGPEGKPLPMSYQSDHAPVLNTYAVPEPAQGFNKAPLNLVTYAKEIGNTVVLKDGYSPKLQMAERAVEVKNLYENLIAESNDPFEIIELSRQYSNMLVQFEYLKDLTPASAGESAEVMEFGSQVDADTDKTTSGENVRSTMAAEESDTQKGQQQTERMGRLYGDNQMFKIEMYPGVGFFGRRGGTRNLGGTDFDVMAKEGGIIEQTYAEKRGE